MLPQLRRPGENLYPFAAEAAFGRGHSPNSSRLLGRPKYHRAVGLDSVEPSVCYGLRMFENSRGRRGSPELPAIPGIALLLGYAAFVHFASSIRLMDPWNGLLC